MRRLAVALVLLGITTAAAAAGRDHAQEEALDRAVSAVDPALVAKLHEGNDAMDRNDPATAAQAYAVVHAKAPDIAAVTRRLGVAEARAGDSDQGVRHCREALAKEDTPENHAAVAATLLTKQMVLSGDLDEAMREARAAVARVPNADFAQMTLCQVAAQANDFDVLEACSTKLRLMMPHNPQVHVFSALALAGHKDFDGAERELDEAHADGLDEKTYAGLRDRFEHLRPKPNVAMQVAVGVLVGWLTLLFVQFVLGMMLSDGAEKAAPSRATRSIYRGLVVVAATTFYLSAALGTALLIGFLAILVAMFLWISEASHKLEAAVGVVCAYFGIAALRALLGRVPSKDLGAPIDTKKQRKLREVLDAVAKRLHMPKIDAVYAETDAGVRVVERGGIFGHLRGTNERVLVIGIASLEGLTVRELEALVASELARFRSKDGAGGDLAIVEREALDALSDRMESRGVATAGNPAWWYVRAFRAFFSRITEGAVAFQEELADTRAAKAYGSSALVSALRHVATRDVEIESRATASLRGLLEGTSSLDDVYTRKASDDLAEAIDEALAELADREKRISALDEEGYADESEGAEPAWSLFSNRKELEAAMTDRLRTALRDHVGFEIEPDQASSESTVARA